MERLSGIKKKKLADYVLEEIKRMIQAGELKEGDRLPNQSEFAARLGVSRPSLREAMQTLAMVGAIEQRPGYGSVIKSVTPALFASHLTTPLVNDAQATRELLEARWFIEAGIARLAARNATREEIRQAGSLVRRMANALESGQREEYTGLDTSMHFLLAVASHNKIMLHFFVTIRSLMEQFMAEAFLLLPELLSRSLAFHQRIYQGLRERDESATVEAMTEHIKDIQHRLEQFYGLSSPQTPKGTK